MDDPLIAGLKVTVTSSPDLTRFGPVAETLVKHAKGKRCDLIYIGTRGHSELGKAIVGSTAAKVLHISDLPVLLVK